MKGKAFLRRARLRWPGNVFVVGPRDKLSSPSSSSKLQLVSPTCISHYILRIQMFGAYSVSETFIAGLLVTLLWHWLPKFQRHVHRLFSLLHTHAARTLISWIEGTHVAQCFPIHPIPVLQPILSFLSLWTRCVSTQSGRACIPHLSPHPSHQIPTFVIQHRVSA